MTQGILCLGSLLLHVKICVIITVIQLLAFHIKPSKLFLYFHFLLFATSFFGGWQLDLYLRWKKKMNTTSQQFFFCPAKPFNSKKESYIMVVGYSHQIERPAIFGKGFTAHLIFIKGSIFICSQKQICVIIKVLSDPSLERLTLVLTNNMVFNNMFLSQDLMINSIRRQLLGDRMTNKTVYAHQRASS